MVCYCIHIVLFLQSFIAGISNPGVLAAGMICPMRQAGAGASPAGANNQRRNTYNATKIPLHISVACHHRHDCSGLVLGISPPANLAQLHCRIPQRIRYYVSTCAVKSLSATRQTEIKQKVGDKIKKSLPFGREGRKNEKINFLFIIQGKWRYVKWKYTKDLVKTLNAGIFNLK